MKLKLIIATIALAFGLQGCATAVSPVPGVNIGLEAGLDGIGFEADVNPLSAGCSFMRAVSWNWGENQLCPSVDAIEIPRVGFEEPEATPTIEEGAPIRGADDA